MHSNSSLCDLLCSPLACSRVLSLSSLSSSLQQRARARATASARVGHARAPSPVHLALQLTTMERDLLKARLSRMPQLPPLDAPAPTRAPFAADERDEDDDEERDSFDLMTAPAVR